MSIALLTIALTAAVAFANGANDVSKGVSTLVGSGLTTYRRALAWGTLWTVAGALVALVASAGLVHMFSTQLVDTARAGAPEFPLIVAFGACGWVAFASLTGLPVSTTHALTGAIVGTAVAASGPGTVRWPLVLTLVVLPLALGPLVSAAAAYLLHALAARRLATASGYCICVAERAIVPISALSAGSNGLVQPLSVAEPFGAAAAGAAGDLPQVVVDRQAQCDELALAGRLRLTDAAHWGTSAAMSFARGLNDNPKIIALGVLAASSAGGFTAALFVLGALAMGAGSYVAGRRVTETLAERVTRIDPLEGLSASAVASSLVLVASFVALPVSTTHVATGAILGAGLRSGPQAIRWPTVAGIVSAWVVTVPAAALISAALWTLIHLV